MTATYPLKKTYKSILLMFVIVIALYLSGCSSGPSPLVSSADSLVKAFITASEEKDLKTFSSLLSEDAIYMDQGSPEFRGIGEMYFRNIQSYVAADFTNPSIIFKFESYFVSHDGASAAIRGGLYHKDKSGSLVSVPTMTILQIKDGKIVREDVYYDYTPFQ